MIISVINHTNGRIGDEELQAALRAINRQIANDFEPYWSMGAELRLEGRSGKTPKKTSITDMRGDAVLYLWDQSDTEGALGYHDANNAGIPYGFVFTEISRELGEAWTVTLSHEALEMIADPEVNLLVMGPHPVDRDRVVFHWYEMCDAVQAETYLIDGVAVSNFVLPLYFTGGDERGGRNDYLGRAHGGKTLTSFGVNPGGYVGFFDHEIGKHDSFDSDDRARTRRQIKFRLEQSRRGVRYQRFDVGAATSGRRSRAARRRK